MNVVSDIAFHIRSGFCLCVSQRKLSFFFIKNNVILKLVILSSVSSDILLM